MTLREVTAALKEQHGVEIGYDSLNDLINAGDIATQLQITGTRAGRNVDPTVVSILADFIGNYRRMKGRLPQAPDMLRAFLSSRLVKGAELAPVDAPTDLSATSATSAAVAALPAAVVRLVEGVEQLGDVAGRLEDLRVQQLEVFTLKEAARFLRMSPSTFRKHGPPPYRTQGGKRWRREDLLRPEGTAVDVGR